MARDARQPKNVPASSVRFGVCVSTKGHNWNVVCFEYFKIIKCNASPRTRTHSHTHQLYKNPQPDSSRSRSHVIHAIHEWCVCVRTRFVPSIVFNYLNEKRQSFAQARTRVSHAPFALVCDVCVCVCVVRAFTALCSDDDDSAECRVLKCCAVFALRSRRYTMCHI